MNTINRLILRAKKHSTGSYLFGLGFINYAPDEGSFVSTVQIWDGKPGTAKDIDELPEWWNDKSETQLSAAESIKALFSALGVPDENQVIMLMDYGEFGIED